MSDIVPFVLSQEQARIKLEISGKELSVIFDGTTRLGEDILLCRLTIGIRQKICYDTGVAGSRRRKTDGVSQGGAAGAGRRRGKSAAADPSRKAVCV